MKDNFKIATYISLWDTDNEIVTTCLFNPNTNEVKDIEQVEDDSLELLEKEWIEYQDKIIEDFYNLDDNIKYINGISE